MKCVVCWDCMMNVYIFCVVFNFYVCSFLWYSFGYGVYRNCFCNWGWGWICEDMVKEWNVLINFGLEWYVKLKLIIIWK